MRAGGEKVLDDPKLLRKSLKKEAKRKEKSAKGWEERIASQKEQQEYKQNRWVGGERTMFWGFRVIRYSDLRISTVMAFFLSSFTPVL